MYNVALINLSADARSVAAHAHIEQREVGNDALQILLRNFCEIDPIENSAADTEIRVKIRRESYLIRTGQKKLILYDMSNRELPGQSFSVEQTMNELDGTAAAARNQAIMLARAVADPGTTGTVVPVMAPPAVANKPRLVVMAVMACLLLGAILFLAAPFATADAPAGFVPVARADRAGLQASLAGVYLTGSEPGQHGIVMAGPGELKLFELGTVEAPRVIYASYELGRVGPKLCLATDQPGGLIETTAGGNLVYCGEVYQRIP